MLTKYLQVPLVVALLFTFAAGQVNDPKKFSRLRVSEDLRERLAKRFNLFVEYERTQQYEMQWSLLSEDYIDTLSQQGITRSNYAEFKRELEKGIGTLLEMQVRGIERKPSKNMAVGIRVKSTLRKGVKTYTDEPSLIAYLQGDEWYFSLWYFDV